MSHYAINTDVNFIPNWRNFGVKIHDSIIKLEEKICNWSIFNKKANTGSDEMLEILKSKANQSEDANKDFNSAKKAYNLLIEYSVKKVALLGFLTSGGFDLEKQYGFGACCDFLQRKEKRIIELLDFEFLILNLNEINENLKIALYVIKNKLKYCIAKKKDSYFMLRESAFMAFGQDRNTFDKKRAKSKPSMGSASFDYEEYQGGTKRCKVWPKENIAKKNMQESTEKEKPKNPLTREEWTVIQTKLNEFRRHHPLYQKHQRHVYKMISVKAKSSPDEVREIIEQWNSIGHDKFYSIYQTL